MNNESTGSIDQIIIAYEEGEEAADFAESIVWEAEQITGDRYRFKFTN